MIAHSNMFTMPSDRATAWSLPEDDIFLSVLRKHGLVLTNTWEASQDYRLTTGEALTGNWDDPQLDSIRHAMEAARCDKALPEAFQGFQLELVSRGMQSRFR